MNKTLKIASIAAIITAALMIPVFGFAVALDVFKENITIKVITAVLVISGIPLGILILRGYLFLANKNKLDFLKRITTIAIVFLIVVSSLEAMIIFHDITKSTLLNIALLIVMGCIDILFGIAILKLKKKFGKIITGIGVIYIVQGVCMVTVILGLLIPFTGIASSILEAILFFRAAKKYK